MRPQNHRQGMQGNEEQGFIPGLPNEIVLEHIVSKLPWRSMCVLVRVSREFRRAIRSREIYNVRKRLGVTQSMAVVPVFDWHLFSGFYDLESRDVCFAAKVGFLQMSPADLSEEALYWTVPQQGEHFIYWVPQEGRRSDDKLSIIGNIVVLDGKLYVAIQLHCKEEVIQVLDVAACQSEWEHCSNTPIVCPITETVGDDFWVACNEKIFFFHTCNKRLHGKAFDPKSKKWTEIEDRPVNVCDRAILGPEHDQYGSMYSYNGRVAVLNNEIYVGLSHGDDMMVFNSMTGKWRVIPNALITAMERSQADYSFFQLVVINEKLYNFSRQFVRVYDPESNSWTVLQRTYDKDYLFSGTCARSGFLRQRSDCGADW